MSRVPPARSMRVGATASKAGGMGSGIYRAHRTAAAASPGERVRGPPADRLLYGGPMAARPVVGVSFAPEECGYEEKESLYLEALDRAGAEPMPVRPGREAEVPALVRRAKGWVFTGGDDISPEYFGQEPHPALKTVVPARDRMDLLVARAVLAQGLPALGICLGIQLLNVAAGGTLHQDVPSDFAGALPHASGGRHRVCI